MTATIERLPSSRRLPRPAPGRLRPLRAGILNVWEYDDQEFWFAGGRLILRGQNTAGKSKALELLFPFVLDGDTRPQRLDPFGSVSKTMYWNLIEFSNRDSAIGYCWAEFGRVDDDGVERYVTCIVGMRATRSAGKRVDTWFAVTPARVGLDLDLAPGNVPLTGERFRAALPERSVCSTAARDHRAAVDHALFGLGPERYDALLHLLLQLRRPKLSEKLDMTRLGEYLSDAMPPLEHQRMERLATAFARLDEEAAALERLEASRRELHAFLDHYRAHARIQTRLRADEVRSANSQFDRVTEDERKQREKHERASDELATVDHRLDEVAADIVRINGQLAGLDLSKVHALEEVEKRASGLELQARRQAARAATDRSTAGRDRERATTSEKAAASQISRRNALLLAAAAASLTAGVGQEHELHSDQLSSEPDRAQVALRGVAGRRETLLQAVRAAIGAAETARQRIETARRASDEAEATLESADGDLARAEEEFEAAGGELVERLAGWGADWGVEVPDEFAAALFAGERLTARPLLAPARQSLASARSALEGTRALVGARRSEAVAEQARVEAEIDLAPPIRPGRPEVRPGGMCPLWACVDFDPSLSADDRAGLEAGLEASGALDALVGPDGGLVDPDTMDTWVRPAGTDGSVGVPGLVVATAAPVDPSVVQQATIWLGAAGSWSRDGRWTLGPLQGRWSKPSAEYIGAAARAEARRRRIAELTALVVAADAELASLDREADQLDAESARLDSAEAAWPSTERLRDARRDRDRQAEVVRRAALAAQQAQARLKQARVEGQAALDALALAERRAGCPAASVDDALAAVAHYRETLADALEAVRAAANASGLADDHRTRAGESEARAAESQTEASAATAAALSARSEAEELRRTSGSDAEAVLVRQRQLSEALDRSQSEEAGLRDRRDIARDQVAEAKTLLQAAEEQRAEREKLRADALERLAALASTELALLAVGPVDAERDLRQVTAGLGFARAAFERLREVDVEQRSRDAVATRFHNGVTTLQSQLGVDFNPYLDTSDGLEVCYATLNGRSVQLSELSTSVDEQVRRRQETLTAEERELIHRHLLTEVGSHLGERVHAAWSLTSKMNEQLSAHPTRGGVSLHLAWEVAPDAGQGAEQAMMLLRQDVHLLDEPERVALANFLHERVRSAREDAEGADMIERLAGALDYRRWHRFSVYRIADGRREKLTSRTQGVGSGGEQAKLAHLPLFAATAAYYSSARVDAPRLLMLDEAFAGIDDSQRGDCMGMLVELDLDMVLTNYSEWGCYREIPSVATYHLERLPGRLGVTALRFLWDGNVRSEDDPWLEDREAAAARLDGGGGGLFG